MTSISFENRVEGLFSAYKGIRSLDPLGDNPDKINASLFFDEGKRFSAVLRCPVDAIQETLRWAGLVEYDAQGYPTKDLHSDTEEELTERAKVISIVTAPQTPEVHQERAEYIADLLGNLRNGTTLELTTYRFYENEKDPPIWRRKVRAYPNRPLYAGFTNWKKFGNTVLSIWHDSAQMFTDWQPDAGIDQVTGFDIREPFDIDYFGKRPELTITAQTEITSARQV